MFKNSEFSEYAIEKKMYLQVDDETLYYFAKGIQTKDLIEYLFTKEESVVKKYLTEIVAIENSDTAVSYTHLENEFILLHSGMKLTVRTSDFRKGITTKHALKTFWKKHRFHQSII